MSEQTTKDPLLTAADICQLLKIEKTKLYQLAREGMPHFRMGELGQAGEHRFRESEVLHWLENRAPAVGSTP